MSVHCHIPNVHVQISLNILYMLPVAVAQSSRWHCNTLRTSDFVDDVMFSHNGTSGPKFTRWQHQWDIRQHYVRLSLPDGGTSETSDNIMFGWVCQMVAPVRHQTTLCSVEFARWQHQGEVAVYNCMLVVWCHV